LVGGGIALNNIEWLMKYLKPSEVHIGTCVRKDKYGPVQGYLIEKFI
jgi:copper homeostasis protein CutC